MFQAYEALQFPPYPRREIRAHLLGLRQRTGSPMPDAAIDEIVDIACHATETGRRAMLAVVDRASDPRIATTALGIATSLLSHDLKVMIEVLEHAAGVTGTHFEKTTVEVQAHGQRN